MWPLASSLAYLLGAGGGISHAGGQEDPTGPEFRPALEASVGYRVAQPLALGLHARISRGETWESASGYSVDAIRFYEMRTLDLGASCQLRGGGVYFESWIGTHLARGTYTTVGVYDPSKPPVPNTVEHFIPRPLPAAGMLFAVDVVASSEDRLSLFAEFELAPNVRRYAHGPGDVYVALTFGIAVHR